MASRELISPAQYNYTDSEKTEMFVHSVRANLVCRESRKEFNRCRGNIIGRHVDPLVCKEKALSLVNCFQKVSEVQSQCLSAFRSSIACIQKGDQECSEYLKEYQECK